MYAQSQFVTQQIDEELRIETIFGCPSKIAIANATTTAYSNVPNKRACTFISGKNCPLPLIKHKRQTLPEINVHARLFGTLEYGLWK
jgi:hypothetical protein